MELFGKNFVYFIWEDELDGKECFCADAISDLQEYYGARLP